MTRLVARIVIAIKIYLQNWCEITHIEWSSSKSRRPVRTRMKDLAVHKSDEIISLITRFKCSLMYSTDWQVNRGNSICTALWRFVRLLIVGTSFFNWTVADGERWRIALILLKEFIYSVAYANFTSSLRKDGTLLPIHVNTLIHTLIRDDDCFSSKTHPRTQKIIINLHISSGQILLKCCDNMANQAASTKISNRPFLLWKHFFQIRIC